MTWEEYFKLFNTIIEDEIKIAPYDDSHFLEYVKLNVSRMNRWMKQGILDEKLIKKIKDISTPQTWVLITEPWCGDAAHIVPFIYKLSEINSLITLEIQLRDTNSEIDNYLTNGSKSIPKLIIRNEKQEDLFVWGPRPLAGQNYFMGLKAQGLALEQQKMVLQQWYNQDKGASLQLELLELV